MTKERLHNSGQWTQARFNSFVKSALRSASQRWPPKYIVLNEAKVGKRINSKTGRLAEHYICSACKEAFPRQEVQVNHITPVIPVSGFDNWDNTIKRMFCEKEGLEVLCIPCHKGITNKENNDRRNQE